MAKIGYIFLIFIVVFFFIFIIMRSFQAKRKGAYPTRFRKLARLSKSKSSRRRSSRSKSVTTQSGPNLTRVFRSGNPRRLKAFKRFKAKVNKVEESTFPRCAVLVTPSTGSYTIEAGTTGATASQVTAPNSRVTTTPVGLQQNLLAPMLFSSFAATPGQRDVLQIAKYRNFNGGASAPTPDNNWPAEDPNFWIHSGHMELQMTNADATNSAFVELWEFVCIKDVPWNNLSVTQTSPVGTEVYTYDSLGTLSDIGFNNGAAENMRSTGVFNSKLYGYDFLQNYRWLTHFKLLKKTRLYLPNIGDGAGDGIISYEMNVKKRVKFSMEKFTGKLAVAGFTKVLGVQVYGAPSPGTATPGVPTRCEVNFNWVNKYIVSGPNIGMDNSATGTQIVGNMTYRVPS